VAGHLGSSGDIWEFLRTTHPDHGNRTGTILKPAGARTASLFCFDHKNSSRIALPVQPNGVMNVVIAVLTAKGDSPK
jgi:hypothetical protein